MGNGGMSRREADVVAATTKKAAAIKQPAMKTLTDT
jgi:hypothetical protein